jgi:hypothetical protein
VSEMGGAAGSDDGLPVVEPTHELWPDPRRGPFLLTLLWQEVGGRAECVGLELNSVRPEALRRNAPSDLASMAEPLSETGTPLTTTLLRSLKLSEITADVRESLEFLHREITGEGRKAAAYGAPAAMRPATEKRLKRVAEIYREAWRQGKSPVKAVAKRLKVSDSAANSLVYRARSAGLLPPTSAGVPAAAKDDVSPST